MRTCLPLHRTWVCSLLHEGAMCRWGSKPGATAAEPELQSLRLSLLKPLLQPALRDKRRPFRETPARPHRRAAPLAAPRESPGAAPRTAQLQTRK